MRAVLDKSLFSDNVIVTETLDGTNPFAQFKLGVPCAQCGTKCSRGSNLAGLCASGIEVSSADKLLAQLIDNSFVPLW